MPGVAERNVIMQSFPEHYRALISKLPASLQPQSATHGMHSYTVRCHGQARVEVLLRMEGLKIKAFTNGTPVPRGAPEGKQRLVWPHPSVASLGSAWRVA